MTLTVNADQFRMQYREIRGRYEDTFAPLLQKLRATLAGAPEAYGRKVDQNLEAHGRIYSVNAILEALNWRMDVRAGDMGPNLVPEAALKSLERGSRRFLDYLGIERETGIPLMVLETKRPGAELPRLRDPSAVYAEMNHATAVVQGLGGTELAHEWNDWLGTLCDYVQSVQQQTGKVPLRAVITNGDWFIVFTNPADTFLPGGARNPVNIAVFKGKTIVDGQEVAPPEADSRYLALFECLEYQKVIGKAPDMSLATLAFNIDGQNVERMMHGTKVRYGSMETNHEPSPSIWVSPVLHIRSRFGTWLTLGSERDFMIPHDQTQLAAHLTDVDTAARGLLAQANARLGTAFAATDIATHYGDGPAFEGLKPVRETSKDAYLLATGASTHYLLANPSMVCPFHDVAAAAAQGAVSSVAIIVRSVKPRSFFVSGEMHHCAHRDTHAAKASQITEANMGQCGPRSGKPGQAFCEIWRFDEFLCCRTCAFESVCTNAAAFHLPCHPP